MERIFAAPPKFNLTSPIITPTEHINAKVDRNERKELQ